MAAMSEAWNLCFKNIPQGLKPGSFFGTLRLRSGQANKPCDFKASSLRDWQHLCAAFPTLKRGANKLCASGAGGAVMPVRKFRCRELNPSGAKARNHSLQLFGTTKVVPCYETCCIECPDSGATKA